MMKKLLRILKKHRDVIGICMILLGVLLLHLAWLDYLRM